MPFDRPTRTALIASARAEIEAHVPGADARLRRSLLDAIARMVGVLLHACYGFVAYLSGQNLPDTAEGAYLRRLGGLFGVTQIPADFARGPLTLAGLNGAVVAVDTALRRDDAMEFRTLAEATIASGTASVQVIAVRTGAAGNTAAGTVLRFLSPVSGVNASATVAEPGILDGKDLELEESYRARIVARLQGPTGAGAVRDYVAQAKRVSGVTDVHVHPLQYGAGTVGIAPLFYGREDPIPEPVDLDAVEAVLSDPDFKPLCATLTVYALTAVPVDFELTITPDTAEVRAAIQTDMRALFRAEARPGGRIPLSHIREALSLAAGETDHELVSPTVDVDLAGDLEQLSVVGDFDWEP